MTSSALPIRDQFATDHLLTDLKGRSVRGGAITLTAQAIKFALQMGSTMVLARLLTPADFGLIAMVTAVTGFAAMFKDAGLSMATVQREHITHEQISTLFWINVGLSIVMMIVVAALSPAIAWFYGKPELTWITLALAGTFIFGGLTVQHQALLRRQMRFKELAIINVASVAAGIATAIVMAVLGFGYWSLVGMPAAMAAVNCTLVWVLSGWQPGRPVRGSGVRPLLAFGGNLTGANVLGYLRRNLDNVLIGAVWGAGPLGLYAKAYHLILLPIRQINAPLGAVAVPALSRLQSDPDGYRRFYRRFIECIAMAGLPLMVFALIKAKAVVQVFLGDQWMAAVPIVIALAPAGIIGVLNLAGGAVFLSTGRADKKLRATIVTTIIFIAGFFVGLPHGPLGVAIALSITFIVVFPGIVAYAYKGTPLGVQDLFAGLWRPVAGASVAALVVMAMNLIDVSMLENPFVDLAASMLVFGAAYALTILLFPGGRQFLARLSHLLLGRPNTDAVVKPDTIK